MRKTTAAMVVILAGVGTQSAEAEQPEEYPDSSKIREVESLLADDQLAEAAALAEELLASQPETPQLLALLGTARYLDRQYLSAEEPFLRAVAAGHRDLRTDYYLASTLWENGKLQASEAQCRAALERHRGALPLVHTLGRLYLWQGRYDEAAHWIRQAAEQSPHSVDLWLDLASSLEGMGDLDGALEAYHRAVELAPEHYQVRYGLARVLQQLGDGDGAKIELDRYRQLLMADQGDTREKGWLHSQIEYGRQLIQQGNTSGAVQHLEALPKTGDVWVALAEAHLEAGDREASLQALEMAVAQEPDRRDLRARLTAARISSSGSP